MPTTFRQNVQSVQKRIQNPVKYLKFSRKRFSQNTPYQMFYWVLNTPLLGLFLKNVHYSFCLMCVSNMQKQLMEKQVF